MKKAIGMIVRYVIDAVYFILKRMLLPVRDRNNTKKDIDEAVYRLNQFSPDLGGGYRLMIQKL